MPENLDAGQFKETRKRLDALPDCARHLARLRSGHPAQHHISNLIEQLQNFERNPDVLRPMIRMTMRRIEEARPAGTSQ